MLEVYPGMKPLERVFAHKETLGPLPQSHTYFALPGDPPEALPGACPSRAREGSPGRRAGGDRCGEPFA